jgi:hypothetical protein
MTIFSLFQALRSFCDQLYRVVADVIIVPVQDEDLLEAGNCAEEAIEALASRLGALRRKAGSIVSRRRESAMLYER